MFLDLKLNLYILTISIETWHSLIPNLLGLNGDQDFKDIVRLFKSSWFKAI